MSDVRDTIEYQDKVQSALKLQELVKEEIKNCDSQIEYWKLQIEPIQQEISNDVMGFNIKKHEGNISMYIELIHKVEGRRRQFQSLVEESEKIA